MQEYVYETILSTSEITILIHSGLFWSVTVHFVEVLFSPNVQLFKFVKYNTFRNTFLTFHTQSKFRKEVVISLKFENCDQSFILITV